MGAVLQWRKFNFFDVQTDFDEGKLSDVLKDRTITCTGAGRGIIYLGDSNGFIHSLNRQLEVFSFQAHEGPVKIILAIDNSSLLLTVQDHVNEKANEIKVWSPERSDSQGNPSCLRIIRPDPRPSPNNSKGGFHVGCPTVTAISLHPNNAIFAVGFTDGSVMLYRGDIRRDRGAKMRVIVTFSSGAITSLHIRHTQKACHLFATTKNNVYSINCTTKDKETSVELDAGGCLPGCSILADKKHEYELLVARRDAIYSYTTDSRASCYVFEGYKESLSWFRGYLIVVSKEVASSRESPTTLTVYDPLNKLITFSTTVEGIHGVMGEWGGLYVMVSGPSLWHLSEKDLQSKLEMLFRKNQFDVAVNLARTQHLNPEDVAEILKQYGDWLYGKGNTADAMEQYIKTIPHLEPSYVIKKFLDTQQIDNLTTYLQALRKSGHANSDHTTLMLNCYTRLRDSEKLDNFIKEGEIDCDVDLGIKVCRGAGYFDHAMALASKYQLHHHYISILMEDKKDYTAALKYISTLKFEDAKKNLLEYGSSLLHQVPDQMTEFLVSLCTDYKPLGQPIIKEHQKALNCYLTPEEPIFADPEDLEHMLIGHGDVAISFLEKVMAIRPLSQYLYTTLFAELLHQYSSGPEGQDQTAQEGRILKLLENRNISFDRDHALLLCAKHKFYKGKVALWEQAEMFDELLSWFASRGVYSQVIEYCNRHAAKKPQLWCSALRFITAGTYDIPPEADVLNTILTKIDELDLMPALEVVELITSSPHVTLGQVRNYLLKVVSSHSSSFKEEETRTNNYRQETSKIKDNITSITSDTIEFTGTKCNVCNNNLDLPSVHFLCHHSFHIHCFESYSENESECPICYPENKKLRDTLLQQERNAKEHDFLQDQLEKNSDCFFVMAEFLGKNAFGDLRTLSTFNPSPNTTKDKDNVKSVFSEGLARSGDSRAVSNPIVPESESRIRVLEKVGKGTTGTAGEARMRLNEHSKHEVSASTSEGRLRQRQTLESSVYPSAPVPEGRLRAIDKRAPSPSAKVEKKSPFSTRKIPVSRTAESISSSLSNPSSLPKNFPSKRSDNPFEEESGSASVNPFGEDFETEDNGSNPFAENYDESKNPFAEKSPKMAQKDSINPFEKKDVYDPKLNPFED